MSAAFETDHLYAWQFHDSWYDNYPDWIFETGGCLKAALEPGSRGKVAFNRFFTGTMNPRIHLTMLTSRHDWECSPDSHHRVWITV